MKIITLVNKRGRTMVDEQDYEYLKEVSWILHSRGYPARTKKVPGTQDVLQILLHRVVAGVQDLDSGETIAPGRVRHRNGNKLDNRRRNLRVWIDGKPHRVDE